MSEVIDSPRWQAVGLLIDQNAQDLLAKRYGLLQEVVSWFKVIALFRRAEDERMIEQEPTPTDLRYHRTWLATLIAEGERFATEIHLEGLAENPAGIKASDVEAAVETLRITETEWYSQLADVRRRQLWKGVFNVEKPGA